MPPAPSFGLASADARAFNWLQETAWPFWLRNGIDRAEDGAAHGFHEHVSLDTHRCTADFRRLRVVTRQIYVFCEAMAAGFAGAEEAVRLGLGYLRRHAFAPDGGYAWRFDLAGQVTDPRRDLYDHAFVLLALSSAMKVMPSEVVRSEALALNAYLETAFPHQSGGYLEGLPPSLPRRQNPHMHLFEACLAATEAFGPSPFLDRADALADLFLTRLWQTAEGALPEYFDEDLIPHRENGSFIVEPGHHAEWVWLLDWHRRLRATHGRPPIQGEALAVTGLAQFYERHGRASENGALVDELWSDGRLRSGSQRLWPQTERLKAEILRPDATEDKVLEAYHVLDAYIAPAPAGLWMERRHADGSFLPGPAPASSLYHLTAAIMVAHRALNERG